ncbi:hypothetical protein T02_6086 [Trichinella nativa]|uniref:Uncharacterized protein n=1 Tax=Trichinella nativa TaxID=6335 RepID=A0A0V1KWJ4_9BILA|nr:hypothetical protein T02_6086 [Trichinella nativa]
MVLHCLVCATACLMVAFDFDMSNQYCRPLWQSEYAQLSFFVYHLIIICGDLIGQDNFADPC